MKCPLKNDRYKKLYEDTLEKLNATEAARQACEREFGLHMQECELKTFDKSNWTQPLEVEGGFIQNALRNGIMDFDNGHLWRIPLDNKYPLCTDEEMIEYIVWSHIDRLGYLTDIFDCDAFSWIFRGEFIKDTLMANCAWICDWSGGHAYNLFVRQNGGLWLYEPQNDRWWDKRV